MDSSNQVEPSCRPKNSHTRSRNNQWVVPFCRDIELQTCNIFGKAICAMFSKEIAEESLKPNKLLRHMNTHKDVSSLTDEGRKCVFNTLASGWLWRSSQKNSSFWFSYQHPSSSADCARELFNGSNGSGSLVDCTRKKFFCLGGAGCLWVTS